MPLRKMIKHSAVTLCLFFAQLTNANSMLLDRMIVYFEPGELPRQDIKVSNIGSDNLYLQTEVYKVNNPGAENEERIRVTDPDQMKLLTTPQKSVIRPKGSRVVRMVNLETPKNKEEVYRVTFKPVAADVETKSNAIQLLIAYQVLVFIRPENPYHDVKVKKTGNKVIFTNNGNSNVYLRNGELCQSENKDASCIEVTSGGRVYAGESLSMELPGKGNTLKFNVFDGSKDTNTIFKI